MLAELVALWALEGPAEAWDAAGWSTSETDTPSSAEEDRWDRVFMGSLRLTASYLHFDDAAGVALQDDALALTVGRFMIEADAGPRLHLSFNGFGELSRAPPRTGLGQAFASAGSTESAYRAGMLGWTFWRAGAMTGQLGVDRASAHLDLGTVLVDVGRFPVNYGVTSIFSTNDFFAPFSATAVNRVYKPGVDAARISWGPTPRSNIDVVGVLGRVLPGSAPTWSHSAVLVRANLVAAGFDWAVLGGKIAERWVAGGSIQGAWGPVNLRTEFHLGVPDADGRGHDGSDRPIYGRIAAGPSVSFAWHNASIAAEYLYASDGAASPTQYVGRALGRYRDDVPLLARHYAALAASLEVIPILRLAGTGLVNASDGSGLAGLSLIYSLADESDLIAGAFVPWGRGLQADDPAAVMLGSEFGLSPISAYLETRLFF